MKEERFFFKNMDPCFALLVAVVLGSLSIYSGSKMIPIFLECIDLLNKDVAIDRDVFFVLVRLSLVGLMTYFVTIAFLLAQKRVFEELYG